MGKTTWSGQPPDYYAKRFSDYVSSKAKGYTILEPYVNANTNILMRHEVCGYEWKVRPNNFIHGGRCPECNKKRPAHNRHTKETFEKQLDKICGEHLFDVVEYSDWSKPVSIECRKCGHRFKKSVTQFRLKPYCPKCNPRTSWNHLTTQEYIKRVKEKYGSQFSIDSSYTTRSCMMQIRCNECGYSWHQRADTILLAAKCDNCYPNMSYGVKSIFDFLMRHKIKFKREVSVEGMVYILPLHFDFVIYDKHDNIICAIEYDGEQHYKPANIFGGEHKFYATQQRDKVKNQFCEDNHIKLYRILWKDFDDIPNILTDILVNEGLWSKLKANKVRREERKLLDG